jgi:hypothetical protein
MPSLPTIFSRIVQPANKHCKRFAIAETREVDHLGLTYSLTMDSGGKTHFFSRDKYGAAWMGIADNYANSVYKALRAECLALGV